MMDCHIHMALDGADWRAAARRHRDGPDEGWIRATLETYRQRGFTYLRDGGDKWGVSRRTAKLAREYGIAYTTPLYPLSKAGHYGAFLGPQFADEGEYVRHVRFVRENGGDFIKLMVSGIMDFDHPGALTEESLPPHKIRALIRIAHEEGMAVMVHANGNPAVEAAAQAQAESIEHGGCIDHDGVTAMLENRVVWVPTLSAVANLRGTGRFREEGVEVTLERAMENLAFFAGGESAAVAPGSDAGAWAVPHGGVTETALLRQALGSRAERLLAAGEAEIRRRFTGSPVNSSA